MHDPTKRRIVEGHALDGDAGTRLQLLDGRQFGHLVWLTRQVLAFGHQSSLMRL